MQESFTIVLKLHTVALIEIVARNVTKQIERKAGFRFYVNIDDIDSCLCHLANTVQHTVIFRHDL